MTRKKNNNYRRLAVYLSVTGIIVYSMISRSPASHDSSELFHRSAIYMDTVVDIKIAGQQGLSEQRANKILVRIFSEIERIDGLLNAYSPDSEVSRINRLADDGLMKVSGEIFSLLEMAINYYKATDNGFDIAIKPLIDLWHEAKTEDRLPESYEVKEALSRSGSKYILLDSRLSGVQFKRRGMGIDLGGIAKGYAVHRVRLILIDEGVENAMVRCGGSVFCLGKRSPESVWDIGIQHPRSKRDIITKVELENAAIDTSGDYERFFTISGKRYSHIIDPRTGYPVDNDVVSASVICKDPIDADVFATALCVLGPDYIGNIDELSDMSALLIVYQDNVLKPYLSEKFKLTYGDIKNAAL